MFVVAAFSPGRSVADHWAACETVTQARDAIVRIVNDSATVPGNLDPYALLRYAPASITCTDGTRITIDVDTDDEDTTEMRAAERAEYQAAIVMARNA